MKTKKIIAFLLVLCLTLGSAAGVFAADIQGSAKAITLEEFTGTVKVTNASGKDVSARNGMRLYSGYTVSTGKDSNAYISLDETQALMLESSSKTILKKSGGKIDVMLESGTVVVDVSKSLNKNQLLNVHTTNMVTGIRGTGVEVSYFSRISATRICMLDGSTQNFNKFGLGEVHVVEAGRGIEIGGGAAVVRPIGDSIAVADLQPETQRLMVVDGGISEDVLDGFNEAFGMDELSEEDAAELKAAASAAVEEQSAEQQAADQAAEASAEEALTAETTGTAITNVDPVFEDQKEATGAGATMTEPNDATTAPADSGSSGGSSSSSSSSGSSGDSGSSGSSGSSQSSTDPVTFTMPGVLNNDETYSFISPMVIIDGEAQEIMTTSGQEFTATPSSVVFWLCYADGSFYEVENVSAKIGSTALSETSAPEQYASGDGMFFAASSFASGSAFSADMTIKFSYLSEDSYYSTEAGKMLATIKGSPLFSHATIKYDSRDADVISQWTSDSKFTFTEYGPIAITVPDGGEFFTVEVANGDIVLSGTSSGESTVYTTDASSLRFTLKPATVNASYYRISDIGPNFPSGTSFNVVTGSAYEVYDASGMTQSFTLTYDIGVTVAIPSQNVNEQEFESTLTSLFTSLSSAPLFGSRRIYAPSSMIGDDPTFNGLVDTDKVIVEPYYIATFVLDDHQTYSYETRNGRLATQPTTPQSYSYTENNETKTLTFKDWARIDMNEPYVNGALNWIVYDPSESINEDLVFYARFTDPDSEEVIVPATIDKP